MLHQVMERPLTLSLAMGLCSASNTAHSTDVRRVRSILESRSKARFSVAKSLSVPVESCRVGSIVEQIQTNGLGRFIRNRHILLPLTSLTCLLLDW